MKEVSRMLSILTSYDSIIERPDSVKHIFPLSLKIMLLLYDTKNHKYNCTNACRVLPWKLLLRRRCVFMQIAIHEDYNNNI